MKPFKFNYEENEKELQRLHDRMERDKDITAIVVVVVLIAIVVVSFLA